MTTDDLVNIWRQIIVGGDKSWVVFEHGTCVVLMEPGTDLAAQAVEILAEYGPVHAGSSAGDFSTITLDAAPGWVVTSHHNDVITYVGPDEVEGDNTLTVGMTGRAKRDQDGRELKVVHVEDKRH